jgi:hypothetical protein
MPTCAVRVPRLHVAATLALAALPVSAAFARPVSGAALEEARVFLNDYATRAREQSPHFPELYSDRAVVRAGGHVFEGRAYKRWVGEGLEAGQIALDASQFHQASVARHRSRLVIRARRYAANRCYWDPEYLVGIEREATRWVIVEERMVTQPAARCAEAAATSTAPTLRYAATTNVRVAPGPGAAAVVLGTSAMLEAPWSARAAPAAPGLPSVLARPAVGTLAPDAAAPREAGVASVIPLQSSQAARVR